MDRDLAVRLAAFSWLADTTAQGGDVLARMLLQEGFEFEGERIPLVAPQGIFKPRTLDLPLTITTTPESPYHDVFGTDGLLTYSYRGKDPNHPDNVGLRRLISAGRPLIYLHGIVPGQYLAVWPVYIVGDSPETLSCKVAVDDITSMSLQTEAHLPVAEGTEARRKYITATVRIRLHQRTFRERVLAAYRSQCALCRLRHRELLDAAHILADVDPEGEPLVTNGISLCKLHHAAFDSFILGIAADYVVHVRRDVLEEQDGPMLLYGLQEMEGSRLVLPQSHVHWPSREALDRRFSLFKSAA